MISAVNYLRHYSYRIMVYQNVITEKNVHVLDLSGVYGQFLLFQINPASLECDLSIFLPLSLLLSLSLFHPRLCCAAGFGGCIRDVRFARRPVVSLAAVSSSAVRVNLDGCLSADTSVNCRGNDSILVYTGRDRSAEDLTLQPFTGKSSIRPLFGSTIPPAW